MTAPGGDGFRLAGAYVEVNLKDNTKADEDKIRAQVESGDAVKIKTKLDDVPESEILKAKEKIEKQPPAKLPIAPDEKSSDETAKKTVDAVSKGITARGALIGTAIAAGVVAGGPLVSAAGIGAGVVLLTALGATLQRGNPALTSAWAKFKNDAGQAATGASSALVQPLSQALGQLDSMISQESPVIRKLFQDAAGDIPILTQGVQDFTQNALPGFESGLANSQPVVRGLAGLMGDLGNVAGELGSTFGANSNEVESSMHSLGSVVTGLGHTVSDLISFSTRLGSGALPVLASGLNMVLGTASGVLHILEPIAPELGSIAGYSVEAFGSFKLASLATQGVTGLSGSLKGLADNLVNTGVKMLDSKAGSTAAGEAMGQAAFKGANFAEKAAGLATTVAGPLGLALGIGSFLLEQFGQSSADAARKQQEQADLTKTVAQALEQSGGVIDTNVRKTLASSLATDSNAQALQKYGVTTNDVMAKMLQGTGSIDATISSLQKQKDSLVASQMQVNAGNNGMASSTSALSQQLGTQIDRTQEQISAWQKLKDTMPDAVKQQQAWEAAVNASAHAMGINVGAMTSDQQGIESYDEALNNAVGLYQQHTSAIKTFVDNAVAAAGANVTMTSSFQQLDAAVTTAEQGVSSAANGVVSAQHSLVDAGHAVDAARHSEQQAVQGVIDAQYSYQQSLTSERQAQQAVMAARQAAADQLANLKRQVIDQGDTMDEAKLRLLQAQQAVATAGLTGISLDSLGDPTAANQTKYQLLLTLREAQHNLNDVTAQSVALNQQNNDAQKAGIDGAQGVIQAEAQLEQTHHSVQQAIKSVSDAQYAEQQATQAVTDAVWSQQGAQLALTQAQESALTAQKNLTAAREADSRTLDINTVAGNRNWQTIEDLFSKNLAVTGSVADATTATENETTAMGFSKDAVKGVIDTVTGLNGKNFAFSLTGTPTLDLKSLMGIQYNPTTGLFTNAQGESGGIARAGGLAAGGPVSGPGGPKDDLIHARLSDGEYVQPADAVNYYGSGFMEAVRSKRLPRFANGGPVAITDIGGIMNANKGEAAMWGMYEAGGLLGNAMGVRPPLPTAMPKPGNVSQISFSSPSFVNGAAASGGVAKAAQAYAAAQLLSYGWGGDQMGPLIALWNQESGWNPYAVNPSSGAYGIPQSLGHGHPYDLGDYVAQINWGLSYIRDRYGSPGAAEGHEQAFNWYADGGIFTPMAGGTATVVPPKSVRMIGDNAKYNESYIPWDGSQRSKNTLAQTNDALGNPLGAGKQVVIHNHITVRDNDTAHQVAALAGAGMAWSLQTARG